MKISVVMATYNADKHIEAAITSFLAQDWPHKELLIADGGSQDATTAIISRYGDAVAWWRSERDRGIFDAWNHGIAHAGGDWIYFMGADDKFHDDSVLSRAADRLSRLDTDTLVAYGRVVLVDATNRPFKTIGAPWNAEAFRRVGMTIPHQGVFTRKEYFQRYGEFDITLGPTATYEFYLRRLANFDAHFMPDLIVGDMGLGGVSTRPENQLLFMNSYIAAQRKHGVFRHDILRSLYYLQALLRRSRYLMARTTFGKKVGRILDKVSSKS